MTIIGTCGHDITDDYMDDDEFANGIIIRDITREFEPCLSYILPCRKCRKFYEDEGIVFKSEKEAMKWLQKMKPKE